MLENVWRTQAREHRRPAPKGAAVPMRTPSTTAPWFDMTGHEFRRFTDGTTLLVTPGGQELLVAAPVAHLVSILARCDGSSSLAEIAASSAEPMIMLGLLRGLLDAGCLSMVEMEVSGCLEVFP
ncbi:MAG TPA: hypothetical protein VGO86_13300 [Candidatus Dormibacteraeota bacterium]